MNNSREGRIAGRVAVVTGGAQGIGFGIASRLAQEGADIVIADIKRDASKTAAEQIATSGGKAKALHVDIGDDTSVAELARNVEALHGRCEILVNNAAIADSTSTENMTMKRYHEVIRVNQDGAIRMYFRLCPFVEEGWPGPPHSQYCIDNGGSRLAGFDPLLDCQGRNRQFHPSCCLRSRTTCHYG